MICRFMNYQTLIPDLNERSDKFGDKNFKFCFKTSKTYTWIIILGGERHFRQKIRFCSNFGPFLGRGGGDESDRDELFPSRSP